MPDHCLICFQEILTQMGWNDVISAEKKHTICPTCKSKLQEIEGHTCTICNRPLDHLEAQYVRGDTCYDCVRWEEDPKWRNCLVKNQSLFQYNDFLQEVMARYKFRGDYILASLFSQWIIEKIDKQQFDHFVPIPLSPERLQERGFNQAEALIVQAGLQVGKSSQTHTLRKTIQKVPIRPYPCSPSFFTGTRHSRRKKNPPF